MKIILYHDTSIPEQSLDVFNAIFERFKSTLPKNAKIIFVTNHSSSWSTISDNRSDFVTIKSKNNFVIKLILLLYLVKIFITSNKEKIILINIMNVYSFWFWAFLAKCFGHRAICRVTGMKPFGTSPFKDYLREVLIYLSFHASDKIMPVSISLVPPKLKSKFQFKVFAIPQGIDVKKFGDNENYYFKNKKYIFVGRLVENKGILKLIEVFQDNDYACRSLTVVGDGPLKEFLSEATKNDDNINLLGSVEHARVCDELKSCNALILPSEHEGTPNVVLEAIVSKVLVISTPVGEINELLTDGRGILMQSNSCIDISDAISRSECLQNRDSVLRLARHHVVNNYSYSVIQKKYDFILEALI